jgi:hypothetical protein
MQLFSDDSAILYYLLSFRKLVVVKTKRGGRQIGVAIVA